MSQPNRAQIIKAPIDEISREQGLSSDIVQNIVEMLSNGSTVPFIARYRKEQTGLLKEEKLFAIQARLIDKASGKRTERQSTKPPPSPRFKIDPDLAPLADKFEDQSQREKSQEEITSDFINPEKGIKTSEEAIAGAINILAAKAAKNSDLKNYLLQKEKKLCWLLCTKKESKKEIKPKFEAFNNFREQINKVSGRQILIIRRGEKEGFLKSSLQISDEENITYLLEQMLIGSPGNFHRVFQEAAKNCYDHFFKPVIEMELRSRLNLKADEEALKILCKNLKETLMAPPALGKIILGVDPGFKSGTKLAVIDSTGGVLGETTIYPTAPQNEIEASKTILLAMIENFKVDIIGIGNGTATHEVEKFITNSLKDVTPSPIKLIVNTFGLSAYSASTAARKELPGIDVTTKGAVSIARRVQNPLEELVKIEPKQVGLGPYQYDANQAVLKDRLQEVVETCVCAVGANINTAPESFLGHVPGVGKVLAKNIVSYREKNGPFVSRSSFVRVPQFGPKAFEQAAGFLRIINAENPLDSTRIHPERYELIKKICESENTTLKELIGSKEALNHLDFSKFSTDEVGQPTLDDIKSELEEPNRDPRKKFAYIQFNPDIKTIEDLKEGLRVEGVVTHVTDFGVFVNIGVKQDGMIHVSELSRDFFGGRSPSPGDIVKSRVISVDPEKKRISLSMRESTRPRQRPKHKKRKHATINQLVSKFSGDSEGKQNNIKLKFSLKSIMKSGR